MEFCCVLSFLLSKGDSNCCFIAEYPQLLFSLPSWPGSGVISFTHRPELGCAHTSEAVQELAGPWYLHPPTLSTSGLSPFWICLLKKNSQGWQHVFSRRQINSFGSALHSTFSVLLCCFAGSHFPVGVVPPRTKSPMPESSTIASYVTLRKNKKIDLRTVL